MANKQMAAFRIAPELMTAMRRIAEKEGIPQSRQVDFALRKWLKARGVDVSKAANRRAGTHRKASARKQR